MSFQGAIATPHALATRAGADTYAAGGNAIDAALAAAAVLTVVYPHQCALGGDLFALVAPEQGPPCSVSGAGAAALATDVARLRARYSEMPDSGPDAVTVPGVVAGWQSVHALGGRLPLRQLLEPAIDCARSGVPVSASLARGIAFRSGVLAQDAGLRALFLPGGAPLSEGARLIQPALAATLQRLAEAGLEDFYRGEVARQLAAGLAALGSPVSAADLAAHASECGPPLERSHLGLTLATSPPPSQGFVLLMSVAALEALQLDIDPLGGKAVHLLQALLLAMEDRERHLGDPRHRVPPLARLLDPASLAERLAGRLRAPGPSPGPAPGVPAHGDTVAVCTLDSSGCAVCLIQSVYQTFGAGLMDPATGIILHNRARGFSLRPEAPNALLPGMRPAHTLMPLLIRRDGRTLAAAGTMGGRAQPQVLAQLLPALCDPERALAQAVQAPRWVVGSRDIGFERLTVAIEADAPAGLDALLRVPGLATARILARDERVGHAQVVRRGPGGRLQAAADPRSDGTADVVTR